MKTESLSSSAEGDLISREAVAKLFEKRAEFFIGEDTEQMQQVRREVWLKAASVVRSLPAAAPAVGGVPEWLPIADAPRGTVPVLLGAVGCDQVIEGYAEHTIALCTDGHAPTHYQPLPPPPKAVESKKTEGEKS